MRREIDFLASCSRNWRRFFLISSSFCLPYLVDEKNIVDVSEYLVLLRQELEGVQMTVPSTIVESLINVTELKGVTKLRRMMELRMMRA